MKISKLIISLLLTFSAGLYAGDLEVMYKPEIKKVNASEFTSKYSPFRWEGVNKRVAMSRKSSLFDYRIREAIAYFNAEGEFQRLDSWIYNRGSDGEMKQEKFEAYYEKILQQLTEYYKVKPRKSGISGATRSTAYTFKISAVDEISLLVGFEKKPFRADFLCLVVRNYDKRRARGTAASLKYLTKQENGDVMVGKIPMINQGPLGYCVPATLARIGQHYGVDISMHEIAMIADSSSKGGTSSKAAMASLKKKYARVKLKIKDIKIKFPGASYISGRQWVDITKSEAKSRVDKLEDSDSEYKKFVKEVKKRIDKGYMIAWTMVVGLLPENGEAPPQDSGGHMRMIIGYNDKTQEIIFSDSWGPGHEVKRLPMKSAFIVSNEIYEIIP